MKYENIPQIHSWTPEARQGIPVHIDFRISDFVVTEEKHLHVYKNIIKNNANYLGWAIAFKTVK